MVGWMYMDECIWMNVKGWFVAWLFINKCIGIGGWMIVNKWMWMDEWMYRDEWLDECMLRSSPICAPKSMNSEDPLFLLYTSGSTGKPKVKETVDVILNEPSL